MRIANPAKSRGVACPLAGRHGGAAGARRDIFFHRGQAPFKGVF